MRKKGCIITQADHYGNTGVTTTFLLLSYTTCERDGKESTEADFTQNERYVFDRRDRKQEISSLCVCPSLQRTARIISLLPHLIIIPSAPPSIPLRAPLSPSVSRRIPFSFPSPFSQCVCGGDAHDVRVEVYVFASDVLSYERMILLFSSSSEKKRTKSADVYMRERTGWQERGGKQTHRG